MPISSTRLYLTHCVATTPGHSTDIVPGSWQVLSESQPGKQVGLAMGRDRVRTWVLTQYSYYYHLVTQKLYLLMLGHTLNSFPKLCNWVLFSVVKFLNLLPQSQGYEIYLFLSVASSHILLVSSSLLMLANHIPEQHIWEKLQGIPISNKWALVDRFETLMLTTQSYSLIFFLFSCLYLL